MTDGLNDLLDDLYSTPLADFVQRRNEAVKTLKAEGRKEEAARIKSLKKPSTSAWVVNQLHFLHGDQIEELTTATEAVRRAHGDPGESLPDALMRRRESIDRLMTEARDVLGGAGLSPTREQLRRIHRTLEAATAGGGKDIPGRLVEDLEATGFGALAGLAILPQKKKQAAGEAKPKPGKPTRRAGTKAPSPVKSTGRDAAKAPLRPPSRGAPKSEALGESDEAAAAEAAKARASAEIKIERAKLERAEREVTRAEAAYLGAERHVRRSEGKIKDLQHRVETAQGVLADAKTEAELKKAEFSSAKEALARAKSRVQEAKNR